MAADGFFQFLKKKRFLNELCKFGVMGIEKSDEDGIGVDLTGGRRRVVVRECGMEWYEGKKKEEGNGDTIDGRGIHGAHSHEEKEKERVRIFGGHKKK